MLNTAGEAGDVNTGRRTTYVQALITSAEAGDHRRGATQALSCSPNLIGICAPAAPPIMLRIGTHSLNPIPNPNPNLNPNPNPTQEHTVTLGLQLSVLRGDHRRRVSELDESHRPPQN